jgi:SAM-dependent methyltransferase
MPLLAEKGALTPEEIAAALGLHPVRAKKWLVLLERTRLLINEEGKYSPSVLSNNMFWEERGKESYFVRDMIGFCRRVNELDFSAVLKGLPLPEPVRWPPRDMKAAEHLEKWMSVTAADTIGALENGADWAGVEKILDVGGGDATIACALVRRYPGLHVTVFNLPASAALARARIAREGLSARVAVVEGNFFEDTLPAGFDRVLFSRVLADWDLEPSQTLIRKARAALKPGGTLLICEPFIDRNRDLALSWQFRYIFYDDFGAETYKFIAQYEKMLGSAGFAGWKVRDRVNDTLYGVITATA